jgi:hypothetical protein
MARAALTTSPGNLRGVIVFVGDSNQTLSASQTAERLLDRDNAYALVDIARPGSAVRTSDCPGERTPCASYDFWQTRIAALEAKVHPDAYVIDLGINDTVRPGTATSPGYSAYGTKIDWLLAQLGHVPIFWSNLPCSIEPAARANACAAVNAALTSAQARHDNLIEIDWSGAARGHRKYLGPANTGADIHLTVAGAIAWSTLIAATIDARLSG